MSTRTFIILLIIVLLVAGCGYRPAMPDWLEAAQTGDSYDNSDKLVKANEK